VADSQSAAVNMVAANQASCARPQPQRLAAAGFTEVSKPTLGRVVMRIDF
jgi:hypothetical protein